MRMKIQQEFLKGFDMEIYENLITGFKEAQIMVKCFIDRC